MVWRSFKIFLVLLFCFFGVPIFVSFLQWQFSEDRPGTWRQADWTSSGILPGPQTIGEAEIHVLAARTGRWKGALSVHSWLLIKGPDERQYRRYEVVGWGDPVRVNAYAPDARWYSNEPEVFHSVTGDQALRLLPKIQSVISSYPHAEHGDYVIWPGPNSNSFIAYVLDGVPEIGFALPSNAIGRDYSHRIFKVDPDWDNFQFNYRGYFGFAVGRRHGLELSLLGFTAGLDVKEAGLKLPGLGTLKLF